MCDEDSIRAGDYVVIQRQGYMKLHKLKEKGTINLGKFIVELDNVVGHKFHEPFQMKPKGKKQLYTLEKVNTVEGIDAVNIETSGKDNRTIMDGGSSSQTLSKEDLEQLRSETSSTEILGKLVANSKTFNSKTEYSQEKYLKKKQKKYFDYICVRRPTVRLMADMFFKHDPFKTLGMRIDDLSQILTYGNVQSDGVHLLYDSGTAGLMPAAILNAIGSETEGKLVHLHPGNEWQKNAMLAMQFPREQYERCVNVNIYSVLRWYYQHFNKSNAAADIESNASKNNTEDNKDDAILADNVKKRKLSPDDTSGNEKKKPCWHYDNEKACELLQDKVESLIVVSKEHPVNIVRELIPFLNASRNLVVFNQLREPLQDLYFYLKGRSDFINVMIAGNFMRQYQVLPNRTHPIVTMNFGGYILYGTKTQF